MRRREFITLVGGAAAWPLRLSAEPVGVKRIGILMGLAESDPEGRDRIAAFRRGLRELGWIEGHNVRIEYRWAAGDVVRTRRYATELVSTRPDVLLVNTPPGLAALRESTREIPIVFVQVVNAVESIASLARPGGNITGFANVECTMTEKWLQILKEIAPYLVRVALVQNPQHPSWPGHIRTITAAAPVFGVQAIPAGVHDAAEIERVIGGFARDANGGLLILPDTFNTVHRELIITLVERHRLPAVYPSRFFAIGGGLLSYGADLVDLLRKAASYVDRILKGVSPADLPVQESTKFELVINLKTAKALGLEIPAIVLARADEVIE